MSPGGDEVQRTRSPVAGWSKPSVAACSIARFAPLPSGNGRPCKGRS